MSFLEIQGLTKAYGDFTAVRDLSLGVERGELVALLGPSGCGKTTTLQMIAGFVEPTRGEIRIGGKDITRLRPERRGIGIVFQSYALFPHMTVADNIGFGLEMRGIASGERRQRIEETLSLVRLDGLGGRYPRELSGGQRQRVAIARALVIRPEVLLLDEPMSNLDAKLREDMHIELRSIQRQLGITTILVTHDQTEAMTMSERIAIMHGGRIVQLATPFEAYERPASAFVSSFLGKTNAVAGRVVATGADTCDVAFGDCRETVPHHGRITGADVEVYIRPEKIRLAPTRDGSEARVSGTVKTRLFLGSFWMLEVDTSLGTLRVSLPNSGEIAPGEGAPVGLAWSGRDLRILDREAAHV